MDSLLEFLRRWYLGDSEAADRFRYCLLAFDLLVVGFFLISTMVPYRDWFQTVNYVIAGPLVLDFLARMLVAPNLRGYLRDPVTIADVVVVISLFAPLAGYNLSFLRVLRVLRLFHSYRMQRELRRDFRAFKRNEDIIEATVNLVLFIIVVTAMVFVMQSQHNPDISNYLDALYFTIATLTTTGFGDITLRGTSGRLLSVIIMVVGVGLFLQLMRTIFRPPKVSYRCPACGLSRHDTDAVHCKACGEQLNITDEGD